MDPTRYVMYTQNLHFPKTEMRVFCFEPLYVPNYPQIHIFSELFKMAFVDGNEIAAVKPSV